MRKRGCEVGICRVLWLLVLAESEHADLCASYLALDGDAGVWHAHDEREFAPAHANFRHGNKAGNGHLAANAADGSAQTAGSKWFDDRVEHGGQAALLR